jgi:thermostable 8-oxoguanine DNA glycosylase
MKKEFYTIKDLLSVSLKDDETQEVKKLFSSFKEVKLKGFFTKEQFYNVAMWKTPRPKKHYLNNSEEFIKEISKGVLSASSEEAKIRLLTSLDGVSIAVASSLLTMIDPLNYGIIDIRVWQLLYLYGEIRTKPKGQGFNINDWLVYLSILRKYASQFKVNVRDIERTLFFHHRKIQAGNLYLD